MCFRFFEACAEDCTIDVAIFFTYIDIGYKVPRGKYYESFAYFMARHDKRFLIVDDIAEGKTVMALEELVKPDKVCTHMCIWLD